MAGAISAISHDGFRSENLATFIFSSWGTVVSTPTPQDYGIDLHCCLIEKVGQRAWARSPYSVQVKSNLDPWVFDGVESVRWLVEHPLPLFLCVVEKATGRLRVYHTSPRFYVWALGELPPRLTLTPKTDAIGQCTQWEGGVDFSLSAPILDVSIGQIPDDDFMRRARATLEFWIRVDNDNLGLLRAGLLRFKVPHGYTPNDFAIQAWVEQGCRQPSDAAIQKGVVHLAEALDCLGSQLFARGDVQAAAKAALLYRHLFKSFPIFFDDRQDVRALGPLYEELKSRIQGVRKNYLLAGIDRLEQIFGQGIGG